MFKPVDPNINFPEMEKKWLRHWYEYGVIKKYLSKNKNSKKYYSFQDGPITANNPMGVHHAWGRTYKDLWPKFFNLLGYKQRFQNGFDCQGLWVEVEVEKELKLKSKKDIENLVPGNKEASIAKFVSLCKERVLKYSSIQTEQSKRLGYFADWDNSYFTMSDNNNYMIWHFLKKCYEYGWIYKGHESVPWCPRCETAISQHEMLTEDYKEVVHESIYFELPIEGRQNEYLLVWTTTPWTLPANIAVAIDATYEYSLVKGIDGNLFWIAKELVESIFKGKHQEIVKTVKGKELVGLKYFTAFDELDAVKRCAKENPKTFHKVIPTDPMILPISLTEGTGMVHTAVAAGVEDFKLGKKLGLPMIPVIGDNADYISGLGEFGGKNAKKHPRLILDFLVNREKNSQGKENWVFLIHNYKHRYPACWRCKTELVWKVADEWYIAMDTPIKSKVKSLKSKEKPDTFRNRMIEVTKKITWMPSFGLDRELDWLKNMHDWLISKKNRYWGLALPIYECSNCGNFEVIGSKEELKKRAIKGWDQFDGKSPHKPYVDNVLISCSKCKKEVKRIDDVGNPWLDAGIVPYSTISEDNKSEPLYTKNKAEWKKWFPVDFITESFPGQFKNWFYAMIAMSAALENTNPFQRVLGFATQFGEDGRPMHKSWGNSVEFNEGADKIGVDVMRWMFTRHNPADNMLFGYKKADEVRRQFYLMLWNIYKFFIEYANLEKYEVQSTKNKITPSQNILDIWIKSRFTWLVENVEKLMREYDAKNANLEIEKFVSDLSTWYIRRSRDRVWVNSEDESDKLSFYSTLYDILKDLTIIISPFIPFVSEEMYKNLTDSESVHMSDWPKIDIKKYDLKLEEEMMAARTIVEAGHSYRKLNSLKVRIPLAKIELILENDYAYIRDEVWEIVLKELNIKNIVVNKKTRYPKKEAIVTEETLKKEGALRELIRSIQAKRKELGLKPTDAITVVIPIEFKDDLEYVKKKIIAKKISVGETLKIS